MIRAFYGLKDNPFDLRQIELLPHQRDIYDTLKVHCQQGGLCLVIGNPGTGKTVIKEFLKQLPDNQHLVATIARTLHTYTNTVKILCEAFRIEFESSAFKCERKLIEQAFDLNRSSKMLITIIDDAHLMDMDNLRNGVEVGKISAECGKAAMEYIQKAADLALSGDVAAMVTAPINKEAVMAAGYHDTGHMKFLTRITGTTEYAAMLATGNLKVVHLSDHYPLKEAREMVTRDSILAKLRLIRDSYKK